jgi:hypothetical protein
MELWLRRQVAVGNDLEADIRLTVGSQDEWREAVRDPGLISSVLWPAPPLFPIAGRHFVRRHPHERHYENNRARNRSYRLACSRLASRLHEQLGGARCLVYAPLRGALPLWRVIRSVLPAEPWDVYHPVTSSFVFFPPESGIRNRKGRIASGRFNNRLELERLRPFLAGYDAVVYLDEIVSGGAMLAHLDDMEKLGIPRHVAVYAAGLADSDGRRSELKRTHIVERSSDGRLAGFLWEGCAELITEDQKFLLGIHYTEYDRGLHVVPVLDAGQHDHLEKIEFERDVLSDGPCLPGR